MGEILLEKIICGDNQPILYAMDRVPEVGFFEAFSRIGLIQPRKLGDLICWEFINNKSAPKKLLSQGRYAIRLGNEPNFYGVEVDSLSRVRLDTKAYEKLREALSSQNQTPTPHYLH